jgi:ferric-dicitrate binding protein FerR (iron transport regulator)
MTDDTRHSRPGKPLLGEVRDALHSSAAMGPARLELEKRRLLARLEAAEEVTAVSEARNPRTRRWLVAAAAVLLALGGAAMWRVLDEGERARVPVALAGLWRLSEGDALSSGSPARVPGDRGAKIVWPDQTAIWLGPDAEISLAPPAAALVRFRQGRLLASVRPVERGGSFRVSTPAGMIVVHGTAFSVTGDSRRIALRLYEGRVTFEHAGKEIALTPGSELVMEHGRSPEVRKVDDMGVLADLMIAERTAALAGPPVPVLGTRFEMSPIDIVVTRPAPAGLDETPPERPSKRRPKTAKPGGASGLAEAPQGQPERDLFLDPEIEAIEVKAAEAPGDEDPAPLIEPMIQKGRYPACVDAADAYLEAHPGGVYAERVQFLKGYCQTRSGNLKAGREAFETYLVRFPEGRYWKRVSDILGE